MRKTRIADAHPVAFAAVTVMKMASADTDTAVRPKARDNAPRRSPAQRQDRGALRPSGREGFRLRWLLGRGRPAGSAPSARPAP